ncbi:hypothetical protein R5R35_004238 [Gryllus longicercus]|uniref:Uncharacterized protein n=1 Tax=Gryllus longicercus TaxID=2509291 RepID=A0AAN9VYU6_9ORTH|nr:Protein of unknown function [Gryllus bimaculatus]
MTSSGSATGQTIDAGLVLPAFFSTGVVSPTTAEAYRAICESDTIAARIVHEIVRIVGLLRGDGSNTRRMRIADDFVDLLKGITTPSQAYMFVKKFASICRKITQKRRKILRGGSFTHFSGKPRRPVPVTKKHSTRPKRNVTWNQPYVIGRLIGQYSN